MDRVRELDIKNLARRREAIMDQVRSYNESLYEKDVTELPGIVVLEGKFVATRENEPVARVDDNVPQTFPLPEHAAKAKPVSYEPKAWNDTSDMSKPAFLMDPAEMKAFMKAAGNAIPQSAPEPYEEWYPEDDGDDGDE